jgi:hypothetical protein
MFQNQGYMHTANWQIADGMTVYATDGTKLGTVRNYDPQAGYIDVHKGVLFTKDFYVPMDGVDAVAEDGVTLRLTKEDLDDDRYSTPSSATMTSGDDVLGQDATSMTAQDATSMTVEKQPIAEDAEQLDQVTSADDRPINW